MDKRDIAVLRVIDGLWETYEWVPIGEVSNRIPWSRLTVKALMRELERRQLISWKPRVLKDMPGVKITEKGLDTLAVWDFMKHGVIDDIGHVVGEGKESVIVLGLKGGEKLALKFHRYYSAEFRRIGQSLSYSAIRWWKKRSKRLLRPVNFPRAKAQVEYHALKELGGKVSVPRVFGINRHALAMEFIGTDMPAPLLSKVDKEPWMKDEILSSYEKALKCGIVHGDLSKFNVMVHEKLFIIDWPQAVPRDFEGAEEMIERDRKNVEAAFST